MRDDIEQETGKARDLLRDAIESLSEGFALYDEDNRLVMFNARYREMNGLVADLLEPGLDYEIMLREMARRGGYADAIGQEEEWIAERIGNSMDYDKNVEVRHTNGKTYSVSVHPTTLGGFVVTRTDITERKQSEANEREGDLLVRRVLEGSPAAVIMARVGSGEIVYRSPAAIDLLGKIKNANEFFLSRSDRADYITALLADEQVDEYKLTLKNAMGDEFPAMAYGRLVEYKGEEVVVTTIIDLTKQNEAEALVRQVLEACPVPIQMSEMETGEILFSGPATEDLFGKIDTVRSVYFDVEDRRDYIHELTTHQKVDNRRLRFVNAQQTPFWCAVSSRLIDFQGKDVIVSTTRDMTEDLALQEELENQREIIFQNEKMSALGELLAGVAHELNNPLSIVVGHSLMMREDVREPEMLRRIEKISGAAERCAKIVKTFLAMARQQPARMERIDIDAVVATAVDVAGYGHARDDLEIVSSFTADLPDVIADSDQITQVVINLVMNAGQAIASSGVGNQIEVATSYQEQKNAVEISVTDNGPGIPQNISARIFEPFFTTKDVGEGTGIGLAFCHRIIHSHNGQIWHDDDYKTGTRFVILLPVAAVQEEPCTSDDAANVETTTKRVLVVDDEPDVAELISEILIKDGMCVDQAHSGEAAIAQMNKQTYDVVLSDLNMPGVDGRGIYDALLSEFTHLLPRSAFITGDTMGESSQKLLRDAQRPYLEKPVSPSELRRLVHDILNTVEETI